MKITIMDGAREGDDSFDRYMEKLVLALKESQNGLDYFKLRDLEIKQCIGCWVKTPGECVVPDSTKDIRRSAVNSDLLIFASPLVLGFTTAILKKAIDKMIPIIHPYLSIREGEIHHRKRYRKYPLLGVIVEEEKDTNDTDIEIAKEIYRRLSINMASKVAFFCSTSRSVEEVAHEIGNL